MVSLLPLCAGYWHLKGDYKGSKHNTIEALVPEDAKNMFKHIHLLLRHISNWIADGYEAWVLVWMLSMDDCSMLLAHSSWWLSSMLPCHLGSIMPEFAD